MNDQSRNKLIPIDVYWTMKMAEDISAYLYANRKKIEDITALPMAIHIIAIIQEHLDKNDYKLIYEKI